MASCAVLSKPGRQGAYALQPSAGPARPAPIGAHYEAAGSGHFIEHHTGGRATMSKQYHFRLQDGRRVTLCATTQKLLVGEGADGPRTFSLGHAETRLLQYLIGEPGVTRSREELMQYAWVDRVVAPGSLNQAVFNLRNYLDDGRSHDILQTVPRRGYRFNARYLIDPAPGADAMAARPTPPQAPATATAEANAASPIASPASSRRGRTASWAIFYTAVIALLAWAATYRNEIASSLHRDVHVEALAKGNLAWHFVGADKAESLRIKSDLSQVIDTMPATARGTIWANRMFRMYDFSCVRTDGSDMELVVSEQTAKGSELGKLLASCLERTP